MELNCWEIFWMYSEERLSFAANTFWPQKKTADILRYPKRQRATQKKKQAYFHLLQGKSEIHPLAPVIGF